MQFMIHIIVSLLFCTNKTKVVDSKSSASSFGYYRAEIIGALLSVFLIWGLTAGVRRHWPTYKPTAD